MRRSFTVVSIVAHSIVIASALVAQASPTRIAHSPSPHHVRLVPIHARRHSTAPATGCAGGAAKQSGVGQLRSGRSA